jgi:hypothetical protein
MKTFIPNLAGIAELGRSKGVLNAMVENAERAAAEARSIAPVDSGDFQDSIHVEVSSEGNQPEAQVVAGVDYAVYVELGTSDTPTFATLRRGSEAAGLKLR